MYWSFQELFLKLIASNSRWGGVEGTSPLKMGGAVFTRSCGPTRKGACKAVCWLPGEIQKAQASSNSALQPRSYTSPGGQDEGKASQEGGEAPQETGSTRHRIRLPRIRTVLLILSKIHIVQLVLVVNICVLCVPPGCTAASEEKAFGGHEWVFM